MKKLIIIGETHDKNEGTDLLKNIVSNVEPLVFLEISEKLHVSRLFNVWTSPGTFEYEKRRKVLLELALVYKKTYFPDIHYGSALYMDDSLRESTICTNIIKKMETSTSETGVLLIGFTHVNNIYHLLKNNFNIKICIPSNMDKTFYKVTSKLVQETEGVYFNAENIAEVTEKLSEFIDFDFDNVIALQYYVERLFFSPLENNRRHPKEDLSTPRHSYE